MGHTVDVAVANIIRGVILITFQEKEETVSVDISINAKLVDSGGDDRVSEENNDNEIATNTTDGDYFSDVPERAGQLCGSSSDNDDDDSISNIRSNVNVDVDDGKEHSESSGLSQKQFSSSKQFQRYVEL